MDLFDGWSPWDIPWLFNLVPPGHRFYVMKDGRPVMAGMDEAVRHYLQAAYARQIYAEMVDPERQIDLEVPDRW